MSGDSQPSGLKVFLEYLQGFQGVGYMLTVIVAAVSLYYALAGEINANKLALDVLKEDVAEIKADLKQAQFNTRVTRLEERVVSASEDLQRLETKTDALDDRMRTLERSRRRR